MNCRMADFIRYSIVLEILLEMRFCATVGVPKKSGITRLSGVFATDMLANFQDRLVMTASIPLRVIIQLPGSRRFSDSGCGKRDFFVRYIVV